MQEWVDAFPNVCFSISATLLRDRSPQEEEAVHTMAEHRILLESDSPFLLVPGATEAFNHPWAILDVARRVARIRGVSVASILATTTANARRFFQL